MDHGEGELELIWGGLRGGGAGGKVGGGVGAHCYPKNCQIGKCFILIKVGTIVDQKEGK